jgi:hypothetical protein
MNKSGSTPEKILIDAPDDELLLDAPREEKLLPPPHSESRHTRIAILSAILGAIILITILGLLGLRYFESRRDSNTQPPTNQPATSPTPTPFPIPDGWTRSFDSAGLYSLAYPDNQQFSCFEYDYCVLTPVAELTQNPPSSLTIYSFFPNSRTTSSATVQNQDLDQIQTLEQLSIADPSQENPETGYTRVKDATISGQLVKVFENNNPADYTPGFTERKMLFSRGAKTYVITAFFRSNTGINSTLVNQLMRQFRLTSIGESALKPSASLTYRGGLCMTGDDCQNTYMIYPSGQITYNGEISSTIPQSEIMSLQEQIRTADYAAIKARPFNGTCPTAFDGSEAIYTLFLSSQNQTIETCITQIEPNQEPFRTIRNITDQIGS